MTRPLKDEISIFSDGVYNLDCHELLAGMSGGGWGENGWNLP